jgi:hypothetical protein
MTERVKSGLTWRGLETDFTVELVRHRQTKETEQIGFTYGIPRQSSTLPHSSFVWRDTSIAMSPPKFVLHSR